MVNQITKKFGSIEMADAKKLAPPIFDVEYDGVLAICRRTAAPSD